MMTIVSPILSSGAAATLALPRIARISLNRTMPMRVHDNPPVLSESTWARKSKNAGAGVPLSDLVFTLSTAGRHAFEEAQRAIDDRLSAKLQAGEISRLAYFRSKARITQSRLAELSNVPQPNISKLERTGQVSLRMASRIAPHLGISVAQLLGLKDGDA